MTRTRKISAVVIGLLMLSSTAQTQPSDKPSRELVKSQDPIANRLSQGDKFVTIRRPGIQETPVEYDSPERELRILGLIEELIVVRQLTYEPYLADNGTWIGTRATGRVSQVLKTGRLALSPGSTVEFEIEGGEMVVKGVRVLAGSPMELTGRTHLIGLQRDPATKTWRLAKAFELNDAGTLGPIRRRGKPETISSKLHGKSVAEIQAGLTNRQQK